MTNRWLDISLNDQLRKLINDEEWACNLDPSFENAYNLLCVMMERLDYSIKWLNEHSDFPADDSNFFLFIVHADLVMRLIVKSANKLGVNNPYAERNSRDACKYFGQYCRGYPYYLAEERIPDDIVTWSYMRAMAFAHSEETGAVRYHGYFLSDGEVHYCPYPVVDCKTGRVGVMVYSNKWDGLKTFMVPFEALKNFISSRYNILSEIIEFAKKRTRQRRIEMMREEIDESGGPIETLKNMRNKYVERFGKAQASEFDFAIMCMTCELTMPENARLVAEFRSALEGVIKNVVPNFKRLEYDEVFRQLDDVCNRFPIGVSNTANYQLQKIFTHLKVGDDKYELAKECAENLSLDYPAKYVRIDVSSMSDDEIKLLITVACYHYRKDNPKIEAEENNVDISLLLRPIPEDEIQRAKELIAKSKTEQKCL